MSRDINKMCELLKDRYIMFESKMSVRGIPFIVTSVDRTIVQQMALYVQGRMHTSDINIFRFSAGFNLINDAEAKLKVTWTLDSKHVTNMFDDRLDNDCSRAFDIALKTDMNDCHWDTKVDLYGCDTPDYLEAGEIGESCGLVWGGRFPNKDCCHFQLP